MFWGMEYDEHMFNFALQNGHIKFFFHQDHSSDKKNSVVLEFSSGKV